MTALRQPGWIRVSACLFALSVLLVGTSEGTPSGEATTIGDLVWLDEDRTGIQPDEPIGIPGVRVELLDAGGNFLAELLTDANGQYAFQGLTPGLTYRVRVEVPPGLVETLSNQGNDDTRDSDAVRSTGTIFTIPLVDALDATRWDIGLYRAEVGDRVWADLDNDGRQDAGEPGLPGVMVELLDEERNVVDSAVTDSDGRYVLTGNGYQSYRVRVQRPPGHIVSPFDIGDDLQDSDIDRFTAETVLFRLSDPLEHLRWDAGLHPLPSVVGDRAWLDVTRTGIQPEDPVGIAGIRLELLDEFDTVLAETTTDGQGRYRFEGVPPGFTYRLRADPPVEYVFSVPDQGSDDTRDSDFDPEQGWTEPFVQGNLQDPERWDLGLALAGIGDRVWYDEDRDGFQDSNEPGLPGATLQLLDAADDSVLEETTTDAEGRYAFGGERLQRFRLRVIPPPGLDVGPRGSAGDAVDSDFDPETAETENFTLLRADDATRFDAGAVILPGHVGNRVWSDVDRDGIQDENEPGVAGVPVQLRRENGQILGQVSTDADGEYGFAIDRQSTYFLTFLPPVDARFTTANAGEDDALDSDADPETGNTAPFTWLEPINDNDQDAGLYYGEERIGDRVWSDIDGDGIQGEEEPGLPGVTIELFDRFDRRVGNAVSTDNGRYAFSRRFEGEPYRMRVILPPTGSFTVQNAGSDDEQDSDVDRLTAMMILPSLTRGAEATRWDVGIVFPDAMLGGRLWKDSDGDGLQDPREPGLSNHVVRVFTTEGDFVAERTTDVGGGYLVGGLIRAVTYAVTFAAPPGMRFTTANVGTDDLVDSDADSTGRIQPVHPATPEDAESHDAGVVPVCPYPDRPVELVHIAPTPPGQVTLEWLDPNPASVVTGYVVRRALDKRVPIPRWTVIARNEPGQSFVDDEVLPRGEIRYYLIAAFNDACDAEGPW